MTPTRVSFRKKHLLFKNITIGPFEVSVNTFLYNGRWARRFPILARSDTSWNVCTYETRDVHGPENFRPGPTWIMGKIQYN
jgi:hypothetical protein